ncbi:MAG: hypothetical protein NTAFB01_31280 [Nitrospira sp.]
MLPIIPLDVSLPVPLAPLEVKWAAALGRDYTHGNDVQALIDGPDALQAIYEAIETTNGNSHFIYLLAWWLELDLPLLTDKKDTTLRVLLEKKAAAGVQIRVMVWRNLGKGKRAKDTPEQIKQIIDAGQNLDDFIRKIGSDPEALSGREPLDPKAIVDWVNTLPRAAAILDFYTATPLCSHHQKLLCVLGRKGLIATCGGVDVNKDRVDVVTPGKGEPLHDVHCAVRGPAAADLVQVFIQRWDGHPSSKKRDREKGPLLGRGVKSIGSEPTRGQIVGPKPTREQTVRILTTYNAPYPYPTPIPPACKMERTTREGLLGAIKSARKFIYFEDQYLVSMTIADALRSALKNIQFVIALVPASQISDLPQVWKRRKEFIEHVDPLGGSFRVYYLWDPQTKNFGKRTHVHAKTWIFDDELAYVGSANVNNRGLSSDSEVGILVTDKRWAARPPYGFTHALRMRLWREHLGIDIVDAVHGWDAWDKPTPASRVLSYNRDADKDPDIYLKVSWEYIDPDMEHLPKCTKLGQPKRLREVGHGR